MKQFFISCLLLTVSQASANYQEMYDFVMNCEYRDIYCAKEMSDEEIDDIYEKSQNMEGNGYRDSKGCGQQAPIYEPESSESE